MLVKKEILSEIMECYGATKPIIVEEFPEYSLVYESEWDDEGKYQYKQYVFSYQNKLYSFSEQRSGSYFSDYNYGSEYWDDEVEVYEVEPKEKTIIEYVAVKKE